MHSDLRQNSVSWEHISTGLKTLAPFIGVNAVKTTVLLFFLFQLDGFWAFYVIYEHKATERT